MQSHPFFFRADNSFIGTSVSEIEFHHRESDEAMKAEPSTTTAAVSGAVESYPDSNVFLNPLTTSKFVGDEDRQTISPFSSVLGATEKNKVFHGKKNTSSKSNEEEPCVAVRGARPRPSLSACSHVHVEVFFSLILAIYS